MNKKPLTNNQGEVRELTQADFALAKPLKEVMPPEFVDRALAHTQERKRVRGKQKAPTKQLVTLRLSPEVIAAFKATGKGWQSRINETLLNYVKTLG
ncbi:BrnA antitoxin family protein [Pasteurellaceae bacterium 20609_3]|uniref:BrnA antitoxin family protein n=1 Tax=Spirabiliibacterium mucosae TaxID=28156 RepID=UPI001AAD82A3|nr:BrnA antitoxin family protein [Spirabiliibacterium mucosae]MBE2897854.1 BrnA antitoxin family protein [Spirabiliibacterium mucosae]